MNVGRASPPSSSATPTPSGRPSPTLTLKRKFCSLAAPYGSLEFCYPSPPMSGPPSPPSAGPKYSGSTGEDTSASLSSSVTSIASLESKVYPFPPVAHPARPDPPSRHDSYGASSVATSATHTTSSNVKNSVPLPSTASSTRSGRKSKAHVASACINCKRAHLSCDVQRPCVRCVASGKQDTCYDVKHKKRGRPRLREETDFGVGQKASEHLSHREAPAVNAPSHARPIATPRGRRNDSPHSVRSQIMDGPSYPPSGISTTHDLRPSHNYQQLLPTEVPTVFLDVNLVVLRANRPFEQIMFGDQDASGRFLSELAVPVDGHGWEAIRRRIKNECDTRDPSCLPPILPSGQDQLHGVSEMDVDRLTSGFEDNTYVWTRNINGHSSGGTFPARLRVGKALSYFIVVTLPSFRPYIPTGGPVMSIPHFPATRPPVLSPYPSPSWPPPRFSPTRPPTQQPPMTQNSYNPSSWPTPYLPPHGISTPRLPVAEPPTQMDPFSRRSSAADISILTPGAGIQLPPLGSRAPSHRDSLHLKEILPAKRLSSDDDRDDRSPKRPRRMGIDEVLQ